MWAVLLSAVLLLALVAALHRRGRVPVPPARHLATDGRAGRADERARSAGISNVALYQADVTRLPASFEGSFDLAYSCLVHHHLDGMTHDEVGELLGISGAAVRKRISTFREKVRGRGEDAK